MRAALLAMVLAGCAGSDRAAPLVTFEAVSNDTGCYTTDPRSDVISVAVNGRKVTTVERPGGMAALAPGECWRLIPTPMEANQPCDRDHVGQIWAWWVCNHEGRWMNFGPKAER